MVERTVVLASVHGLHARPAAEFVKLASRFEADVKLRKDDLTVDGKSIMGVMMLAAEMGSRLTLIIDGSDESQALEELARYLETNTEEEGT
ncbi:MAG: HPr family phosphocarrier protein [Candidatus Eisenbacteria bacterium]|nr:HPr family phosphocarrier protein [Candidatus Eisenbacteria bacterium]